MAELQQACRVQILVRAGDSRVRSEDAAEFAGARRDNHIPMHAYRASQGRPVPHSGLGSNYRQQKRGAPYHDNKGVTSSLPLDADP